MSGTKEGGLRASATNKKIHGEDFYRRIGQKGGLAGHTGGFYARPELARIAGAKGGRKSKRGLSKKNMERINLAKRYISEYQMTKNSDMLELAVKALDGEVQ